MRGAVGGRLGRWACSMAAVAAVGTAGGGLRGGGRTVLPARRPLELRAPLQDKNFLLLSLMERDPAVRRALAGSAALAALGARQRAATDRACAMGARGDAGVVAGLGFTEAEIVGAAAALAGLARSHAAVRRLAAGPLRASGVCQRQAGLPDDALIAAAWRACAAGINNIIAVYGLGRGGRSPQIDGISEDPKGFLFGALVHNELVLLREQRTPGEPFFRPALGLALGLMEANRRDEAGRFEPLERGENRAACRRMARLRWGRWPYTAIIAPGYGPEEAGVALSAPGHFAVRLAARRYRAGLAPFILVSGGFVHPKQTPWCEALEMKRALMREFGVPEAAIILEPHARHTTTNLRNAARLLYRCGAPVDRPALIATNTYQSAEIEGPGFGERCREVFGYLPGRVARRVSPFDLAWLPSIDSLQADPMDPLDP